MKILVQLFFIFFFVFGFSQKKTESIHILIITGGHDFERPAFFKMFDEFKNISYEEAIQPKGNILLEKGEIKQFDVIVFYDMYNKITEKGKLAYTNLLDKNTAMVFLHHSLVSYQNWPEFINIIGGKFIHKGINASTYEHDVAIDVMVTNDKHPITKGITNWQIIDETYGKCILLPTIQPLLKTNNKNSMPYLAWTNNYKNSTVTYIQSGHGSSAFTDTNYKQLVEQAIRWSAEHHNQK